ncbi:hypothetical protein CHI07_10345 [Paenibacillus sp. 7884-2]|nr:hypothetical protein CHI07_10345 [Paenibacillus sp. 7884-2]
MKKLVAGIFIIFGLILSACSGGEAGSSTGDTLVVGAVGDPQTYNPDSRPDDNFYPMAQNIYSRLIKLNNNQEIIPDLAKDWEVSEDGTEITFNLHENVTWHDGEPFTSSDAKFTLDMIIDQNGAAVDNLGSMEKIETPDDHTVLIKLSQPDASFLGYLAWYATFIVPEHIYDESNWDSGTSVEPIGTGPFKFVSHETGVRVELESNDDYFGGTPKVDRLVFSINSDQDTQVQAFYNGELDILGGAPPVAEVENIINSDEYKITPTVWPSRQYLAFNVAEEPFNDPNIRQAIAYALDNEDITKRTDGEIGEAATHFLSPSYEWALDDDYLVPEQNQELAKAKLEEAGLEPDGNGNYLSVSIDIFESGNFSDIATVVKEQLSQVGIYLTINSSEYAAWQEKVVDNQNFQMSLLGGYQGPDVGAIASRVSTTGDSNFMGYSNTELDELLDTAGAMFEEEERVSYYSNVQRILLEDMVIYPISEWVGSDPVHAYVEGDPFSDQAIGKTGFAEYTHVELTE